LAELLGTALPQPRLPIALGQARAAAARCMPEPPRHVYQWTASCRAHDRLARASWARHVWGPPASEWMPKTNDTAGRAMKRMRRAAKLIRLNQQTGDGMVNLATAAGMSGLGERTLQSACESGRLPARRDFTPTTRNGVGDRGRWLVRIADVRRLLEEKLRGRPVAA
jgi:hypothetical protein